MEPGLSAQPLSGFQGKQPIYVKFENGVVELKDENLIEKMLAHPAYTKDGDFIVAEDGADPFADRREELEPTHIHTQIKYGHVEESSSSPMRKAKVNPELKKLVNDLATKQMQDILPGLVAQGVKDVLAAMQADQLKDTQTTATTVLKEQPASPVPSVAEENPLAGLSAADFLEDEDAEEITEDANEDINANTDAPGGIKLADLSPEAAEIASAIIGNKKKTPAVKAK